MDISTVWEDLAWQQGGKIIYLILDGVGGLSDPDRGGTELQVAQTPNLDQLAKESSCGLSKVRFDFEGDYFFETVSEHRAVFVLRGQGLGGNLADTDPQTTGVPAKDPTPESEDSKKTAELVRSFIDQVQQVLADEDRATGILMRGFEQYQPLPAIRDRFKLDGVCVADYPMYRGVSRSK
ncbi:MAG: hypothetical protein RIG63_21525 [Coleofasciculus chthonoplastes F3-SA18-01]|jgi:2,3-bisphosphoglycerate-independent phosphoglycerate mutase|uniref:hypothetical protein n=1 Tax=Coleofasciculus chthonoplastes TaxID=64178 RepID=UPI00330429E9